MAFRLEHGESVDAGVRRVAIERLDDAIARLDGLGAAAPASAKPMASAARTAVSQGNRRGTVQARRRRPASTASPAASNSQDDASGTAVTNPRVSVSL